MPHALLALGSNLGEPALNLEQAVRLLRAQPALQVLAVSRWYATKPIGGPAGQADYLNGAVLLETSLPAVELWQILREIEQQLGRTRAVVWGARTLDLDLLLYDSLVSDTPELQIPHPRMMSRRFVMEPAAEIAPEMVHPLLNWRLADLQQHLALARNYVAFAAPPQQRAALGTLAAEIQQVLGGALLEAAQTHSTASAAAGVTAEGVTASGTPLSQAVCTLAGVLAGLHDQAKLLSDLPPASVSSENLFSNFWLGEAVVDAAAYLVKTEQDTAWEAWQQASPACPVPKLIVFWVPEGDSMPASAKPLPASSSAVGASRPCENSPHNEQLAEQAGRWAAAAHRWLATGEPGPWLWLSTADPARVQTEVTAAVAAMW